MLYRTCPWCGRRWRRTGCRCLAAAAGHPQVRHLSGLDRTLALYEYQPVVQQFLLAAKNGGRRDLLAHFGQQLASLLATDLEAATITWVPASRVGRRRRGYDQARLLARSLARQTGYPTAPLLSRAGNRSQAGRARYERLEGPRLSSRVLQGPAQVVLIDDVVTTGASLTVAAKALRSAGAVKVVGLCVASATPRKGPK